MGVLTAIGTLLLLLAVARWALNPFFALLARARTREVLTAGALLVVLGAAMLMDLAGLSMAMGAFVAGVMLSGSSYRHQIETDVEPFRGLLHPDADESEENPRLKGIVNVFGTSGSAKVNVNDCTVEQLLTVPGIFNEDATTDGDTGDSTQQGTSPQGNSRQGTSEQQAPAPTE